MEKTNKKHIFVDYRGDCVADPNFCAMDTNELEKSVPEEQFDAAGAETTPNPSQQAAAASDPEPVAADPADTPFPEPVAAEEAEAAPAPKPKRAPAKPKAAPEVPSEEKKVTPESAEMQPVENVDFSDEEADLHASSPEFDLGEEHQDEADENEESAAKNPIAEYLGKTKEEIIALFEEMLESKPVHSIRREAEAAKVAFYKVYRQEVDAARRIFAEAGNAIEDFKQEADASEERLKGLFAEYRRKRDAYLADSEKRKEDNYKKKLQVIEELKELINSNETLNQTFSAFRDLQNRWKDAGAVPQAYVKDLWETYHHHVENFYNFIKINNELRDLDLKKNVEIKTRLCEEAEALILEPSAISAFHKLQKLHEQWREAGPVPNEYKEQLWERFREASSKINKRHQDYFEGIKDEQRRNLDLKSELCAKTEELSALVSTAKKDWEKASEQLIEIQKVWKTIGFAPKKENTKIYERFRAACDRFFESKREFYVGMKSEMDLNLKAKQTLCEQAEALQESTEWKKATDELIALQKQWKEIGAVPRKHADAIWKRFRKACDAFFENKSKHFSETDAKYAENLQKKRDLLEEIKAFEIVDREEGFETLKDFQRRWAEIGFVPIREKDKLQAEYRAIIDEHFSKLRGNERERKFERFRDKISNLKDNKAGRTIRNERDRLYNKVKQLEADIALLENNIGFFAKSKNAEAMIRDVQEKIARAKEEMAATIEQVNLIDNQPSEN